MNASSDLPVESPYKYSSIHEFISVDQFVESCERVASLFLEFGFCLTISQLHNPGYVELVLREFIKSKYEVNEIQCFPI